MATAAGRVTRIEACTVRLTLPAPLRLATRTVTDRAFTLVRVHDSDGASGLGFTFAGYLGSDLVTRAVSLLAPIVCGADPAGTGQLWRRMVGATILEGRAGVLMRAISAVDIALWDLRARRSEQPLHLHLGGAGTQSVPAYLAGGYFTAGELDAVVTEARQQRDAGARTVKVKIGAGDHRDDIARVAAVAAAVGPDVALLADANGCWDSVVEALPTARGLRELGLRYLEDPFAPGASHLLVRLSAAGGLPLATGESLSHPTEFAALLRDGGTAVLVVDATSCGGVTAFAQIGASAALAGVPVHTHWFSELHAPLAATLMGDTLVEHFADSRAMPFAELVHGGPVWNAGRLELSAVSGHGLTLDDRAVAAAATDGWYRWR